MENVVLQWATPDIDQQIMAIARVSNPAGQHSGNTRLLKYLMDHGHVSPFEMASACLEINTTRDIGRQILRHRSFTFQEFSQRYAAIDSLAGYQLRETRMQDTKNRQNSLPCTDPTIAAEWLKRQEEVWKVTKENYDWALAQGIAKEQARAVLPEGMTMSRLYMSGNFRSWIFYLQQRLDPTTQKEHREIAQQVLAILRKVAPITIGAFFET